MPRRSIWLLLALLLLTASPREAHATLSPQAYELLRERAPLAFSGTVLRDHGGRMDVRVEQIHRGMLQPGSVVAVSYPEDRGAPPPPGPMVYYRRFHQGDRLRLWGGGGPVISIVHGGIELLYRPPPPARSGGCASCATGAPSTEPLTGWWAWLAIPVALLRRRRRR